MYFPKDLAEACKKRYGEPFQPSNGTEGEIFQEYFCYNCLRDEDYNPRKGTGRCEILLRAICWNIDDPEFPREWIYGKDGQPTCTVFVPIEEWRREFYETSKYREKEKGQLILFGDNS